MVKNGKNDWRSVIQDHLQMPYGSISVKAKATDDQEGAVVKKTPVKKTVASKKAVVKKA